jgi:hypothetical protein
LADSSDEEEVKWGGLLPSKSPNLKRNFDGAYQRLTRMYFSGDESTYTAGMFKRRFRVSPAIFNRIYNVVHGRRCFYPEGTKDATGKQAIHPLVRLTAVFRTLAYGTAADAQDKNWEVLETIANNALKSFCEILIQEFGDQYLNKTPTPEQRKRILAVNQKRGFHSRLLC